MKARKIVCLGILISVLFVSCGPNYIVIPYDKRPWDYDRITKLCTKVIEVMDNANKDQYTIYVIDTQQVKRVLQRDGRTFTFPPKTLQAFEDEEIMILAARSILERRKSRLSVEELDFLTVETVEKHFDIHPMIYVGMLYKLKSAERSDAAKLVGQWPTNSRIESIMMRFAGTGTPQK